MDGIEGSEYCPKGMALDDKESQKEVYANNGYFEMAYNLAKLHTEVIFEDFLDSIRDGSDKITIFLIGSPAFYLCREEYPASLIF